MDFITAKEGEREQTARLGSKVRNRLSQTILFSSKSLYSFANSARLKSLCANKSSIRQGENRPKEPNSYSTMGISVTEVTAAEINHDRVCPFIEVSAVYRFSYKPNLAVLKILYFG